MARACAGRCVGELFPESRQMFYFLKIVAALPRPINCRIRGRKHFQQMLRAEYEFSQKPC